MLILAIVALADPARGARSVGFTLDALIRTAPFLVLSIELAAYAGASGADSLIARLHRLARDDRARSRLRRAVALLLVRSDPAHRRSTGDGRAVMAFWLASPVIDPSQYALTAGVLGFEFATAKTLTAIALGLFGGYVTLGLERAGAFTNPLREGIGNGGCGGSRADVPGLGGVRWKRSRSPSIRPP